MLFQILYLTLQNLIHAISTQIDAVTPVIDYMEGHPGQNVTGADFPQVQRTFSKLGMSLDRIINNLNSGFEKGIALNDTDIINGTALQQEMNIGDMMLQVGSCSLEKIIASEDSHQC
jgi:hypothetical protein